MEDCKAMFLEWNPEFRGLDITQEFITRRVALYYCDRLDMFGKIKPRKEPDNHR
jgi:hypothetical protein